MYWITSLCFSLKVIFQTQNHRSAPQSWAACPETSVAPCFRKGPFYFMSTLMCAGFYVLMLTFQPVPLPLESCEGGALCYRSSREGPQQTPFPVCHLLGWEGSFSSLSWMKGDPWAFDQIGLRITWGFHVLRFLPSSVAPAGTLLSCAWSSRSRLLRAGSSRNLSF